MACLGFGKTLYAVCGVATYFLVPVPPGVSFDCNSPRILLFFPRTESCSACMHLCIVFVDQTYFYSNLRVSVVEADFRFTMES